MDVTTQELLARALALPPRERFELARELARSAAAADPAWATEVGEPAAIYDQAFQAERPRTPEPPARRALTLEFWQDDGFFVGRLCELPGIFSQGETLAELEDNIRDAYRLILEDAPPAPAAQTGRKPIEVDA